MITQIGIVSGRILELIEDKKTSMSIAEIKFYLDEPMDLINMAIGWLVREQYVRMITKGNENYLSLPPTQVISSAISETAMYALNT